MPSVHYCHDVCVCSRAYLSNHLYKLPSCLWPRLDPSLVPLQLQVVHFRFSRWRHVLTLQTQWQQHCARLTPLLRSIGYVLSETTVVANTWRVLCAAGARRSLWCTIALLKQFKTLRVSEWSELGVRVVARAVQAWCSYVVETHNQTHVVSNMSSSFTVNSTTTLIVNVTVPLKPCQFPDSISPLLVFTEQNFYFVFNLYLCCCFVKRPLMLIYIVYFAQVQPNT